MKFKLKSSNLKKLSKGDFQSLSLEFELLYFKFKNLGLFNFVHYVLSKNNNLIWLFTLIFDIFIVFAY